MAPDVRIIACFLLLGIPVGILQCRLLGRFAESFRREKPALWILPVKFAVWIFVALGACLVGPIAAVCAVASSVILYTIFAVRLWRKSR